MKYSYKYNNDNIQFRCIPVQERKEKIYVTKRGSKRTLKINQIQTGSDGIIGEGTAYAPFKPDKSFLDISAGFCAALKRR